MDADKGQSSSSHEVPGSKEATPPSDGPEPRLSRKREREVSQEPATPQAASSDPDVASTETKDRRTPAKKNRISAQLDVPQEEEEGAPEGTGLGANSQQQQQQEEGMSCSPPTESKIGQISQGVEDLTWRSMAKPASPDVVDEHDGHAPMETEHTVPQPQEEETEEVPMHMHGENPPMVSDEVGEDEHAGAADPTEVPPDAQAEDAEEPTLPSASAVAAPQPSAAALSRHGSDDSIDEEKGLKRKMGDRTVSESLVPADLLREEATAKHATTKRARDDEDAHTDANPRLTKRPTPPPDDEQAGSSGENSQTETQTRTRTQTQAPVDFRSQSQASSASSSFTSKPAGFMSYATPSSPFAGVKGPSLFASRTWGQLGSSASSSNPSPNAIASPAPLMGAVTLPASAFATPTKEHGLKRTGFEAFASASSPFATAAKRSKSPPPSTNVFGHRSGSPARHHSPARANVSGAFSAYATGGAHGFTTPARKRAGSQSPAVGENGAEAGPSQLPTQNGDDEDGKDGSESGGESQVTFGERLRSQKDDDDVSDDEKKLNLTEQDVPTGEEDEETIIQARGKLFALSSQNQWKERGTGTLRLNVRRDDGTGARLIMRKEAVYTVLLNAPLFHGMKCAIAQDPRYLRFSVFENGTATHYNVRVATAKTATELLREISAHIP